MRPMITVVTALLLSATAAAAQDRVDSLEERLRASEEALERLQRQLEELNQSKVQSRLRNHVTLSGLILINGVYSNRRMNNSDVPAFVHQAQDTTGLPNGYMAGTVRQSRVGITVSGVRTMGALLTGDLQLDFYGGQLAGGRTHPLLRVRTATARLDWPRFGLLIGQESPLISPNTPISFAASGFPGFTAAGNLWLWIPQVRATFETGGRLRLGFQAAALAPTLNLGPSARLLRDSSVELSGIFLSDADLAEKSGRPYVQGRFYFGWGEGEAESQFGVGIHRGWLATRTSQPIASRAISADWRLALGERVLIHGEAFFNAQALGGLGGGGIGQTLGPNSVPVRTRGAWIQVNLRPSFSWELGGGYGFDDPNEADLSQTTGRGHNQVVAGHLHWRPGGGLLLGMEFRRITTTYPPPVGEIAASHGAVFAGVAF